MKEAFRKFSNKSAEMMGSPWTFALGVLTVVVWGATGPMFRYSDTWQLAINTGTTIITFLMVFLIQATQNRDSRAMQLKLDELIRAVAEARNKLVDLENAPEEVITELKEEFSHLKETQQEAIAELEDSNAEPKQMRAELEEVKAELQEAKK